MTNVDAETPPADRSEASLHPYVARTCLTWPVGTAHRIAAGTLVSADISGFTALTERLAAVGREGSEDVTTVLNGRFTDMIGHVHAHGGDVLKFGGDAILCLFEGDGHAGRAATASAGMRSALRAPVQSRLAGTVQLRLSIGMHSGMHPLFLVDAGEHLELQVLGTDPSLAIAAESLADANEIVASSATAELLDASEISRTRGDWAILDPIERAARAPARLELVRAPGTFLPPSQRERIDIGVASRGEHRLVSVIFVGVGLDEPCRTDAEAVAALRHLEHVMQSTGRICDEYGLNLIATDIMEGGNKVILAAGAPTSTGQDETAALYAAWDLSQLEAEAPLRIGVASGPVFVGDLGAPDRRAYTIMGDPVNLAARLMGKAERGHAVVSATVLERARSEFEHAPLAAFQVKGKSDPILASRLTGPPASLPMPTPDDQEGSFLGRSEEVATLLGAWEVARRGQTTAVAIHGEAGSGKSRLVSEAIRRMGALELHRCRGDIGSRHKPFGFVRDLMRSLLNIDASDTPVQAGAWLVAWTREHLPERLPLLPLVAPTFDAEVAETAEAARILPKFAPATISRVMADIVAAAIDLPVVLWFEDIDFSDAASRQLVTDLADDLDDAPALLLFTSRRPDRTPPAAAALQLDPLEDNQIEQLIRRSAETALSPGDVRAIMARCEGNPLFAAALAAAGARAASMPETVEAAIAARLDRLPARSRELLGRVAVIGLTASWTQLEGALGMSRTDTAWGELNEFVDERVDGVGIRHALFGDVAYNAMSFRFRRRLHRRMAEWLQDVRPEAHHELSRHWAEADAPAEAWLSSVLAGEDAVARFANHDAAALFERAARFGRRVPGLDSFEVARVNEKLGDVAEVAGDFALARGAYKRAGTLYGDSLTARVRLLRKQGVLHERAANYPAALRLYSRALRLVAEGMPDGREPHAAELEVAYAGVRFRQGRYDEAFRWARRAEHSARVADLSESLAHAYLLLDNIHTYKGDVTNYGTRAIALFKQVGDLLYVSHSSNNMGVAAYFRGEWSRAIDRYLEAAEHMTAAGAETFAGHSHNNVAEVYSDQGRYDDAERHLQFAHDTFVATGYEMGRLVAQKNLGRVRLRQARLDEALTLLDGARSDFQRLGNGYYEQVARLWLAELDLERGRVGPANEAARMLAEETRGDPNLRAGALRVAGTAQLLGSDPDGVTTLELALEEAHSAGALFELGLVGLLLAVARGDVEAAASARTSLDELGVLPFVVPPGYVRLVAAVSDVEDVDSVR